MVTFAKRATPSQLQILRAVAGAVKNTADAHPKWTIHPNMARSISKRAAGTLTADWPKGLAAHSASSDSGLEPAKPLQPRGRCSDLVEGTTVRGASHRARHSPLQILWKDLSKRAGSARRDGQHERSETFVEVLRLIASLQKKG